MKCEYMHFSKVAELLDLVKHNILIWSCEPHYPTCKSLGIKGRNNFFLNTETSELYTYRIKKLQTNIKKKMIKKLLIKLRLKSTFSQRIKNTLNVFTVAKNDLLQLNTEIDAAKKANAKRIAILEGENKEHEAALLANTTVISNISLLLGVK